MQVKDGRHIANIFNRISASVTTVNEKIVGYQKGTESPESVSLTVALEQLAMQQEILTLLATMIFAPSNENQPLPELPKKIVGFN